MEAEARASLAASVENAPESSEEDLGTAIHRRFAALGGIELEIPPRQFSNREIPTFD